MRLKHGRVYMSLERFFERLLNRYETSLQWALRHRVFVMAASVTDSGRDRLAVL